MIIINCVSNGKRFSKVFDSVKMARNFILRCGFGKKVIILDYETSYYDEQVNKELNWALWKAR